MKPTFHKLLDSGDEAKCVQTEKLPTIMASLSTLGRDPLLSESSRVRPSVHAALSPVA